MKKTLIASAVAAATLSSTAFAMDNKKAEELFAQFDAMPTFYGSVELVWTGTTTDTGANETSENEFADNGSTFGFKHDHMITDGVKGFLKAEWEFNADDNGESFSSVKKDSNDDEYSDSQFAKLDEAYIGIMGDFGSVQIGSDDTVYEWVDIVDTSENTGISGELAKDKEGDNIQYYSPEMSGLTVGVTAPIDSDSTFGGALAAKYAMDNLEVALAYALGREEKGVEVGDALGLAVSFGIEDLTLMAQYETRDESKSNADDGVDYMALLANYAMGANNFALGYSLKESDKAGSEEESTIFVQALHNVSDNMYVYLEYTDVTDSEFTKDEDVETLAIGATYSF